MWGFFFRQPVFELFSWSSQAAGIGAAAAVPLLLFFIWSLKSDWPVLVRHRELMDFAFARLFTNWRVWQFAAISLAAGVCEEVLFRGAIQTGLTARVGTWASIVITALLFGACHLVSWTYGIIAAIIGIYIGILFATADNLLVPITTHALYDFLALIYFFKVHLKGTKTMNL